MGKLVEITKKKKEIDDSEGQRQEQSKESTHSTFPGGMEMELLLGGMDWIGSKQIPCARVSALQAAKNTEREEETTS